MALLDLPGEKRARLELYTVLGAGTWPYSWGQGQISIQVEDVDVVVDRVLAAGGSTLGEVADWRGPTGMVARLVFVRDPEGNLVDVYGPAD